jgi:SAM-dependent methyltransferase
MTADSVPLYCRSCRAKLDTPFLDLGCHPPSNAFIMESELNHERRFPLRVRCCPACRLVQADDVVSAEQIFNADYAYFSSFSTSWLAHAQRFATAAISRFGLDAGSRVIEVGSNDGYLLQYFAESGVQVLGVDPSDSAAAAARAHGIPTLTAFFGAQLGQRLRDEGRTADLMFGANVIAHVPDLNDFLAGFAPVLKPGGTVCFEFPHLLRLLEGIQFDTIYHEHFSYLSLTATEAALARHDLVVYDLEELPTHGGSLRLYCAGLSSAPPISDAVKAVHLAERQSRVTEAATLQRFAERVSEVKAGFLAFMATARERGQRVVAYGAAAKGNTFLNTCGVTDRDILCVFDRNPHKQGRLMPGSHIPVRPPEELAALRPDYVVVLPWNLIDEVQQQLSFIAEWGGRLVSAIPEIRIIDPAVQKSAL